ncbi:MFS transporter [Massilia horti]|uniref:MFS transporter n=1 Tax=Massilia horti TaxID=2562153 RepID=A0A4Y9T3C6_9BURK|nr:MFS transporter [Massilia horti]TFW32010.1 MFS transporter [Massilia horti]
MQRLSPELAVTQAVPNPLRSPDFRRLWFSNALTNFGAQITMLALPICAALMLHATPAQMGALAALETIPFLLFGLPAGVLLDRSRRLPIMLCSDLMVALALTSVPLAWWSGILSIHWLYAVGFVIGTGYVVGGGAEQVFLTFLVGRDGLVDAQARFASTESASRLLGPGMAGALVQVLGAPLAVLCNAAGFAVSLWNLRRIRAREPRPPVKDTHPGREMLDGLMFVWRHPVLRKLAWVSGGWHLLFYAFMALQVLFATRVLGMAPGIMGTAQMMGGLGVLAGSLLVKRLSVRLGTDGTLKAGLFSSALGLVLLPCAGPAMFGSAIAGIAVFAIAIFWIDCGATLFFIPYGALRQRVTPDPLLGRMVATMRFLTVAMAPLGAMAAGWLAQEISVRTALICVGAAAAALSIAVAVSGLPQVKD